MGGITRIFSKPKPPPRNLALERQLAEAQQAATARSNALAASQAETEYKLWHM